MLRSVALLLLFVATGCATAVQEVTPSCKFQNEAIERSIGFCQAVRVGDVLYVSGGSQALLPWRLLFRESTSSSVAFWRQTASAL